VIAALIFAATVGCSAQPNPIPDKSTAIKAGCAVIRDHFSNAKCVSLVAELKDGVWTVSEELPPGYAGGGPVVELSQTDGRVLNFYVTQ
jgi:hypothetical protein